MSANIFFKKFFLFIFVITLLFAIIIIFEKIIFKEEKKLTSRSILLFQNKNGNPFVNHRNFFTYNPNDKIRISSYYSKNNKFIKEYSYEFLTNNFGFKQNIKINKEDDYILILGNSFGEGQGSPPWINFFQDKFKKDKILSLNASMLGTGYAQGENIHNYLLEKSIKFKKIIIIFISYDLERQVFTLDNNTLLCLKDYSSCNGKEIFIGAPKNPQEEEKFLTRIYESNPTFYKICNFKELIKYYFPNIYLKYKTVRFKTINQYANKMAIENFVKKYKENIIFIHAPLIEEYKTKKLIEPGVKTLNILNSLNAKVIDLKENCKFIPEKDWHPIDMHLNASGNSKLVECIYIQTKQFIYNN